MSTRSRQWLFFAMLSMAVVVWAADPLLAVYLPAGEADKDPVLGAWNLDLGKSSYSPGPMPLGQKRIYELARGGMKTTISTTYRDGRSSFIQYVADYESVENPVTGSSGFDAITLKRISDFEAEATLLHAGQVIGTASRVVSNDGKTMTITFKGGRDGQMVNNIAVYNKEEQTSSVQGFAF